MQRPLPRLEVELETCGAWSPRPAAGGLAGPSQVASREALSVARTELRRRGVRVGRLGFRLWGWPTPAPSGPSSSERSGSLGGGFLGEVEVRVSAMQYGLPVRLLSWGRGYLCPLSWKGERFKGVCKSLQRSEFAPPKQQRVWDLGGLWESG